MKFILHNLHMIWSRLRSNGWVLAELFLVFIVMWFLCDSLGCLKYTFYRPLGYSIDHVYQLSTIIGGAGMILKSFFAHAGFANMVMQIGVGCIFFGLGLFIAWATVVVCIKLFPWIIRKIVALGSRLFNKKA